MVSLQQALKKYFGYDSFRQGQEEIIQYALSNQDLLVIMPTGGGKSLCFQLPALLKKGVTIVVSPLIALMQDQVTSLNDNGINATFLNSTIDSTEVRRRENAILAGETKLVYLAPERLVNDRCQEFLHKIHRTVSISGFAIDEAHCISEWGHDFRQEYRQLRKLRSTFPQVGFMALTATATPRVQKDIIRQLNLRQPIIRRFSFNRPNLYYEVQPRQKRPYPQILRLINSISGSGIIYCFARKTTEELAQGLQKSGILALPYHGGLSDSIRAKNQEKFIRDDVQIIVATIAFGMGINKPDVRFVIHHNLPRNIESYYQESGRAGRDGESAKCILLYNSGDEFKINYFIRQKENLAEQKIAHQQLQKVLDYAQTNDCRRIVQLSYFGEYFAGDCDGCDNCLNPAEREDWTIEAQMFLSCIARTNQRFGTNYIIDVLKGSKSDKIQKYGHHLLSTYGIGTGKTNEQWKHLARSLVSKGLVNQTTDGYNVLKLNRQSWYVLKQQKKVEIAVLSKTNKSANQDDNPRKLQAELLFNKLKQLRKKLADRENVAPYVVFGDSTLKLMAQIQPKSLASLSKLSGITEYKLNKYGNHFVQEILATTADVIPIALPTSTQMKTLQLYQQGNTIEQIAKTRGYNTRTIVDHISELIELNQPLNINSFVDKTTRKAIMEVIKKVGDKSLKVIKENLDDSYSYDQIKFVRAWYRRQNNN